ncbi:MAG: CHAD domain-containing protein [Melioribacteraceae bacterium]|nr:CHAD domain-containing protein [Melioribacteraceae bacterium]
MNFYSSHKQINLEDRLLTLPDKFSFRQEYKKELLQTFYDTYDNKLLFANYSFTKFAYNYQLTTSSENDLVTEFTYNKKISFVYDIPDKEIKKALQKLIGVRALLIKAALPNTLTKIHILNKNKKCVAVLTSHKIRLKTGNPKDEYFEAVSIEKKTEYKYEFAELKKWLQKNNFRILKTDIYSTLLHKLNAFPEPYYYKINQSLNDKMPADKAIQKIYLQLTEVIKYNEEGILKDIDTDFLHDFRVSIRKLRSGLSEIKGIIPKQTAFDFKTKFEQIQKSTNHARDLDVLLLIRNEYEKNLPKEFRSGLTQFFRSVKLERNREYKKLQAFILSKEYLDIIDGWLNFLKSDLVNESENCKNKKLPIKEVAKRFIRKKFRQIISIGNEINENSQDTDFHRLRIECKKLRYMIEFFSSLFPKNEIENFSAQLKQLQNNLGEFNDLSIQQEKLKLFLHEKVNKKGNAVEASSIGGLITLKYQRQKIVRSDFHNKFSQFNNNKNFNLFKNLFD